MGLRIIDRQQPKPAADVSEAEILAALTAEANRWSSVHGPGHLDIQAKFIDNFRRVKANARTRARPSDVDALIGRISEHIRQNAGDGTLSHVPVDIATLLELL